MHDADPPLIEDLLQGRLTLSEAGERMKCTSVDAARRLWSGPRRDAALALIHLADAQAQLAVSRARILAVERLAELVIDAESDDLARRAAVDLLRAEVLPTHDPVASGTPTPDLPVDPDAVLAALTRLTEATNDDD